MNEGKMIMNASSGFKKMLADEVLEYNRLDIVVAEVTSYSSIEGTESFVSKIRGSKTVGASGKGGCARAPKRHTRTYKGKTVKA